MCVYGFISCYQILCSVWTPPYSYYLLISRFVICMRWLILWALLYFCNCCYLNHSSGPLYDMFALNVCLTCFLSIKCSLINFIQIVQGHCWVMLSSYNFTVSSFLFTYPNVLVTTVKDLVTFPQRDIASSYIYFGAWALPNSGCYYSRNTVQLCTLMH